MVVSKMVIDRITSMLCDSKNAILSRTKACHIPFEHQNVEEPKFRCCLVFFTWDVWKTGFGPQNGPKMATLNHGEHRQKDVSSQTKTLIGLLYPQGPVVAASYSFNVSP